MELKPCPFCGTKQSETLPDGSAGLEVVSDGGLFVFCSRCEASGSKFYGEGVREEDAIKAWNAVARAESFENDVV